MKYAEIVLIKMALQKLSEEKLTIAYEIAKNLRACDKIVNETQEVVKSIHAKYADRDDAGNIKLYDEKDGQISKISDPVKLQQFGAEIAKINDDDFEIRFTKIKSDRFTSTPLPAQLLMPLIDNIIED